MTPASDPALPPPARTRHIRLRYQMDELRASDWLVALYRAACLFLSIVWRVCDQLPDGTLLRIGPLTALSVAWFVHQDLPWRRAAERAWNRMSGIGEYIPCDVEFWRPTSMPVHIRAYFIARAERRRALRRLAYLCSSLSRKDPPL